MVEGRRQEGQRDRRGHGSVGGEDTGVAGDWKDMGRVADGDSGIV